MDTATLLSELTTLVGADYVCLQSLSQIIPLPETWTNRPLAIVAPGSVAEIADVVRAVEAAGVALVLVGGGTQLATGYPPREDKPYLVLSLQRLNRILDYQPDDMTITCEPGVTLAQLQEQLATRRQFLPLDVPMTDQATLGGIVAANQSGFGRLGYGAPRDLVIGLRVVLTEGVEIKGGGKVVKNVAGYDVCKLFTGSWGTVGVITEITFKVYPLPESERLLRLDAPDIVTAACAGLAIHHAQLAPASLIATNELDFALSKNNSGKNFWGGSEASERSETIHAGLNKSLSAGKACLLIRLQGPESRMDWQTQEMERMGVAGGLSDLREIDLQSLRTLRDRLGRPDADIVLAGRITCLPTEAAPLLQKLQTLLGVTLTADCAVGVIHFVVTEPNEVEKDVRKEVQKEVQKDVQKDVLEAVPEAGVLRAITLAVPATANLLWTRIETKFSSYFHGPANAANTPANSTVNTLSVWGAGRESIFLHRALKQALDPKGTFNPGRFVDRL